MGLADLVTPETSAHGHDGELGEDDGAADGGGDLLGALDAETDVAVVVSDSDEGLKKKIIKRRVFITSGERSEVIVQNVVC